MINKQRNDLNLTIKYSLKLEAGRVFETIKDLEWYRLYGYKIHFPRGFKKLDKLRPLDNKKDVEEFVRLEYKDDEYRTIAAKVEKAWQKISKDFFEDLRRSGFKPEKSYTLILTKYGTEGGYHWPDKVVLNFRKKSAKEAISIIAHEIIHLLIQPLIEKYKIEHWQKERVVDLMLARVASFDNFNKIMQILPIETKETDRIFNQFFPEMEDVFKRLGKTT